MFSLMRGSIPDAGNDPLDAISKAAALGAAEITFYSLFELSPTLDPAVLRELKAEADSLGLDYSEPGLAEALSPRRDKSRDATGPLLRPGMVFEIHPNFTLPALGHVCAGDVALVTETGAEWLTRFPRGIFRID